VAAARFDIADEAIRKISKNVGIDVERKQGLDLSGDLPEQQPDPEDCRTG